MKRANVCFWTIVILTFSVPLCLQAADDNWPTWRGVGLCGHAADADPPVRWTETENVKWKVSLVGDGSDSSPIVWGDQIIYQTAVKTDKLGVAPPAESSEGERRGRGRRGRGRSRPKNLYQFDVVCHSRKDGQRLWRTTVCEVQPHEGHHGDHGHASYSPVTDGKHIWASFGSRGLYCLDMDGKITWSKELRQMNMRGSFGEGNSPVLVGDALVVLTDQEGASAIAAYHKDTGKQLWLIERDEPTTWTTPLPIEVDGQMQVVVAATNFTRAYDLQDGKEIWRCSGLGSNVAPTTVTGFGMVFCMSGHRDPALQAIQLGRTGDLSGTDAVKWQLDGGTPYVPSPLLYEDKLYFFKRNDAVLSCYDAQTGTAHFAERSLPEMRGVYASPAAAAGRLYFVGRNGVTCVVKPGATLDIIAVNRLDDTFDSSPALLENELILKGEENLYCISAQQKGEQQ